MYSRGESITLHRNQMTGQGWTPEMRAFAEVETQVSSWTILSSISLCAAWIGIIAAPFVMLAQTGTWRGFFLLPILFTWMGFCSTWAISGFFNPATMVMLALSAIFYISGTPPSWFFATLVLYTFAHSTNHHTVQPLNKVAKDLARKAFADGGN